MVAISFSVDGFVEKIKSGAKDQTIRPFNQRRYEQIKRIKKLQLYWKQRTKECFKIADAEVTEIFKIRLYSDNRKQDEWLGGKRIIGYILIEDKGKWRKATNEEWWDIIKRDGISNAQDLYKAFYKTYGDAIYDMEFMVIRWNLLGGNYYGE